MNSTSLPFSASFSTLLLCSLLMIPFSSCVKDITKIKVVYQNDFEDYQLKTIQVSGWLNGSFGNVTDVRIVDYNGSKVLGRFNNNIMALTLNNLPAHTAISVQFDLYIHDKWKNDLWIMSFDGFNYLQTGFSNDSTIGQAYPNWYGGGAAPSPAFADAFTNQLPGACRLASSSHGTSMYKMVRTILHTKNSFQLQCSDATNPFNNPCEISWSIDNLKITAINN